MRLAVLSDIHGNLEALRSVLADAERAGYDIAVSLGDNIGYGPQPQEVVDLLLSRYIPSVMGNHEWGLLDETRLEWFNPHARRALEVTRGLLSEHTLVSMGALPTTMEIAGLQFVHGCPPDSLTTYLFELSASTLRSILKGMTQEVCFVGHTHLLELISCGPNSLERTALEMGPVTLPQGHRFVINVGSVGQPRDGDGNAKWVLWDDKTRILDVRFVPYDAEKTARKIIEAGIPRVYAHRLQLRATPS